MEDQYIQINAQELVQEEPIQAWHIYDIGPAHICRLTLCVLSLAKFLLLLVCVGHVVAMCLIQDRPCFPWPIISDANGMKLAPQ